MTELMLASVGLAGLNLALALVLLGVYARNHHAIGSRFTLGLLLFAVFLLVHNGTQLWHFATMMPSFAAVDEGVVLAENALQAAALLALVAATLR